MIKKIAKKITQICVAIALMIAPVISTAGLGHNAKVYAVQHGTDLSGAYVLNSGSEVNQAGADAFATALATALSASSSDYADIESTATQAGTSVASSNIYVQFGGIKWLVTYVSRLTTSGGSAGDAIATLWMADYDTNITSQWNTYTDGTVEDAYPSSMYGTSYIRALLTGEDYAGSKDAVSLTSGTSVQNALYKKFTGNDSVDLTEYIAKPYDSESGDYVSWQKYGQNAVNQFSYSLSFPNEIFGTLTYTTYESGGGPPTKKGIFTDGNGVDNYKFCRAYANTENDVETVNMSYQMKAGFDNWAGDYIWLPSLTETGMNESNTNNKGLWNLTNAQRQYGAGSGYESTDYSWLRSGTGNFALYA